MTSDPDYLETHEIHIPSDTSQGAEVQEQIIALMEKHQFSTRDIFCTRLALTEGITNAIRHGNRMDPGKHVHIVWKLSADRLQVVVTDEGPGFDLSDLIDPTDEENLERPGGRGIMLMRSFMDRIDYNEIGNQLIIEKIRSLD